MDMVRLEYTSKSHPLIKLTVEWNAPFKKAWYNLFYPTIDDSVVPEIKWFDGQGIA